MTFVITQPCVDTMDKSCVEVCPVDCIHYDEADDRMLYIDPAACIDCGACEPACPVTAIFAEADVPADQANFLEINALWYSDPTAARSQIGGGAPAAAPPAPPAPTTAEETPAAGATEEVVAPAEGEDAAPAADTATEAAVAVPAAQAVGSQVAAIDDEHPQGMQVSQYRQPSAMGLAALVVLVASLFAMIMFPGPKWMEVAQVRLHATILVLAPVAALAALVFLANQFDTLRGFEASRGRDLTRWRQQTANWRRSEESRRYELERTIRELAADRFSFPSDRFPDLRTHVNVPDPTMGLEFTRGGAGGGKVFPDILVVRYPGNYPAIVAQVETRETVTREQASRVWATLETDEAPLYIYVPAGLAGRAKDYARAAGIRHAKVRTWRRQPGGMMVQEL